ncbi:type IV toxin-antitoxin system AbiEi family antitoxin domain-containing protein [Agromyces archimandritae]|nr:hypothetical protein [Agromyces archimandritae]
MSLDLPAAFTLDAARRSGVRKDQVYGMLDRGEIERIGRGVFIRSDVVDPAFISLAAASAIHPASTLCLTSALVHHDLSDAIPFASDIALPRGVRHPAGFEHVVWHSFDDATFALGREFIDAGGGVRVAVYSAERAIVDTFRLMHREGDDVAHEALRRWLRRRGSSPSKLLKIAAAFPKALPKLRVALAVLL